MSIYQIHDYMDRHIRFVYSIEEAQYIISLASYGCFHWRLINSHNILKPLIQQDRFKTYY